GVLCVVPGEIWGGAAQRYFLALEEGINLLPGFSPELQGVYSEMPIIRTHCGLQTYFRSRRVSMTGLKTEEHSLRWLSSLRYI
ncbi:hypothetical protein ONN26_25335, partial [Salmonella enterica subsp. enterica serovar Muenster]|nr:hypothetical protein [Salmonella enterica subsp. enterica serovar Muenster]